MAGLYDRLHPDGLDGNGNDRVDNHLISESISAYVGNTFSKQQIIDAVNTQLERAGSQPLRPADLQDIDSIVDVIDAKTTNTGKLIYGFTAMTPVFAAAHRDLVSEVQWRGALEI